MSAVRWWGYQHMFGKYTCVSFTKYLSMLYYIVVREVVDDLVFKNALGCNSTMLYLVPLSDLTAKYRFLFKEFAV